jgi:hypothetical protein
MAITWPLQYARTDTFFRWGMAFTCGRYEFVTVSLLKRFLNGRFNSKNSYGGFRSETTIWTQGRFNIPAGASRKL